MWLHVLALFHYYSLYTVLDNISAWMITFIKFNVRAMKFFVVKLEMQFVTPKQVHGVQSANICTDYRHRSISTPRSHVSSSCCQ